MKPVISMKKGKIIEYTAFIVVVLFAIFSRHILYLITGSTVPLAVVEGYSMSPILRNGDLVISYKPPPEDIKEGDIVIYKSITGTLVIHRVIKVIKDSGKYYYITKGDNNMFPDPGRIPYSRVEGKVLAIGGSVFKIPYLGYLSLWYHKVI